MAISYVGGATGTTSATLPGFTPGDIAIVFAYRDGNTTPPSLPTGWTNIVNGGGSTNSGRSGWRSLQSGDTTTGTWTNATSVVVLVYRATDGTASIGASARRSGSSTTITYPALTLQNSDGSSWGVRFAGHRSTNVAINTAPSGFINRTSVSDATDEAAGFDSNGGITSQSSGTASVGGTSSGFEAHTIELRFTPNPPPSFSVQPTDQTVTEPATATFNTIVANADTTNWQNKSSASPSPLLTINSDHTAGEDVSGWDITLLSDTNAIGATSDFHVRVSGGYVTKAGGGSLISIAPIVASGLSEYTHGTPIAFSGATPTASGSSTTGVYQTYGGSGSDPGDGIRLTFSLPFDLVEICILTGTFACTNSITATLSDGSAAPVTNTEISDPSAAADIYGMVRIACRPGSAGQTLTVDMVVASPIAGADGDYANVTYRGSAIRSVGLGLGRYELAASAVAGGHKDAVAVFIGDSLMAGYTSTNEMGSNAWASSPPVLMASLMSNIPALASGYLGDARATAEGSTPNGYNNKVAQGTGWTVNARTSLGGFQFSGGTTSGAAHAYTPGYTFDRFRVIVSQFSGGPTYTANVDGGSSLGDVVFGNGTDLVTAFEFSASGTTINIASNGTADGRVIGIEAWDSANKRLRVLTAGVPAWTAQNFATATNADSPLPALRALRPDLMVVMIGTNDITASSRPTYRDSLRRIAYAGKASGSVVFVGFPYMTTIVAAFATQDTWRGDMQAVAAELGIPFHDLTDRTNWTSLSAAEGAGFMDPDGVHFTLDGLEDVAAFLASLIDTAPSVGVEWGFVTDGTGGTTDDYTTPATDVSMDGWKYRQLATGPGGSTYSNIVTLNVDAAGGGVTGSLAATETGSDTFASSGSALIQGSVSAAETGSDVFASTGTVLVSGSLSASESGADTAAISGAVLVQGSLSATETGNDTFAATGTVGSVATGSLAAIETGPDTAAISGTVLVQGALAASETGEDVAAISGSPVVSGSLAAAEAGADTAAIAGAVLVSGSVAATEAGPDTAAVAGAVLVQGSLGATETGSDTFLATGSPAVTGTLEASEAGADTAAASGAVLVSGALAASEAGSDTASINGSSGLIGSVAAVEQGSDTAAIAGVVLITGQVGATEAAGDTLSASGSVLITGSLSASEAGADTFSASGGAFTGGVLNASETGSDTASLIGTVVVSGNMVAAESASDILAATGAVAVIGAVAAAELGADTAFISGASLVQGALAAQEAGSDTFAANGLTTLSDEPSVFIAYVPPQDYTATVKPNRPGARVPVTNYTAIVR